MHFRASGDGLGMRGKRASAAGGQLAVDAGAATYARSARSASADDRAEMHVGQEEQVPPAMVILPV
jgi:hypothetical protein